MSEKPVRKYIIPMIVFFLIVNGICLVFGSALQAKGIDHTVLLAANLLLCVLSLIIFIMLVRAAKNPNPNVFVRTVMGSSFIKLLILATVAGVYLLTAGENRNVPAVIISAALYIIYSFIEIKSTLKFQKENGRS